MAQVMNDLTVRENARQNSALAETPSPAVSVIMPAYNVAPYIAEALDSVFAQTFTDYEIIVVNDGSPDTEELERVLQPYLDRIIYIKQENRGVSGARNTAIRHARGQFIAPLDPDDIWEPDFLAVQIGEIKKDPEIAVVYGNALLFGDAPEAGRDFMEMNPSEGEVTFESLITTRCNVLQGASIAGREAILRAGMYDEDLRGSEDFDLWLRIVKSGGRIGYHRRRILRYRRRGGSLTAESAWITQCGLRVMEKATQMPNLTGAERETLERAQARHRAFLKLYEGKEAFIKNDFPTAIERIMDANQIFKSPKLTLTLFLLRLAPRALRRAYDFRHAS